LAGGRTLGTPGRSNRDRDGRRRGAFRSPPARNEDGDQRSRRDRRRRFGRLCRRSRGRDRRARHRQRPARARPLRDADSEAWDVGLPCGGEIDGGTSGWRQALRHARRRACRIARIGAGGRRRRPRRAGCPVDGHVGAARAVFIDVVAPPARLLLVGAVDIAGAVCTLARATGWRAFVIDPRARFATRERIPDAEDVLALWPEEAFARLGGIDPATAVVALTHHPKLDDAALITALRSPAMFVGAMGSRLAQSSRLERLRDAGLESEHLERLSAPVGLDQRSRAPTSAPGATSTHPRASTQSAPRPNQLDEPRSCRDRHTRPRVLMRVLMAHGGRWRTLWCRMPAPASRAPHGRMRRGDVDSSSSSGAGVRRNGC
jgi:xanthine/CO dehydrogenase XdhC/CoxF family maturation factor